MIMKWVELVMSKRFLCKEKEIILNKLKEYFICLENIIKLRDLN